MHGQPLELERQVLVKFCVPHEPQVAVHVVTFDHDDQLPPGQQEELTAAVVDVGIVHGWTVVVVN